MRAPARPNAFENVRMTRTPSSSRCAAVSPAYSQYASSTTSGRAVGRSPSSPVGLLGRHVNVTTGSASPTSAPARPAATAYSGYVGESAIATVSPGPAKARAQSRIRSSAPGAEHDLLGPDARVVGDGPEQLGVAAVRIGVDLGEPAGNRAGPRRGPRPRRHVAVEADDLRRLELHAARELLRGRRPAVGRECLGQRPHRRTAAACAGMPSTPASASTTGRSRASPSAVTRWIVIGRRNVSRPRPPTARAQPPVGSTWLPPVA